MLGTVVGSVMRGVCVAAARGCCGGGGGAGSYQLVQMTRSTRRLRRPFCFCCLGFLLILDPFPALLATCPNFPQCEHLFSSVLCSQNLELWSFCLQCLQCTFFRHFSVL